MQLRTYEIVNYSTAQQLVTVREQYYFFKEKAAYDEAIEKYRCLLQFPEITIVTTDGVLLKKGTIRKKQTPWSLELQQIAQEWNTPKQKRK